MLARYYNGTVRFGWVDRFEDELLSESFQASVKIPATFLVVDGMVYYYEEYDYTVNMKRFIEN